MMMQIHEGQCGLCSHFGEHHPDDQKLVQIRLKHQAPEGVVDECGHPRHASRLRATAVDARGDASRPRGARRASGAGRDRPPRRPRATSRRSARRCGGCAG